MAGLVIGCRQFSPLSDATTDLLTIQDYIIRCLAAFVSFTIAETTALCTVVGNRCFSGLPMRKTEIITALGIILLGILVYFVVIPLQVKSPATGLTSPRFMPRFIVGAMTVLAFIYLVQAFLSRPIETKKKFARGELQRVITICLILGVYFLGIHYIGYYVSTMATILFVLWYFKVRSLIAMLSIAVLYNLGIYCLFKYMLKMNLPSGILF